MGQCCNQKGNKVIDYKIREFQTQSTKSISPHEANTSSCENIKKFYILDKTIGSGSFGTVKLSVRKDNPNKTFAIKQIPLEKVQSQMHLLKSELEILKSLDHPNIVKFYETYQDKKCVYFVQEYCAGGELLQKILKKNVFSELETYQVMTKLFLACSYIHKKGVVHRDLKPENMLLSTNDDQAEVKVIDFGLSKRFNDNSKNFTSKVGTPLYVAPEVLEGNYGTECDNWSLGIIMYVLLCGTAPFTQENTAAIFEQIKRAKIAFNSDDSKRISKSAKDLVLKLLIADPKKRITSQQALEHEWVLGFEKNKKKKNLVTKKLINQLKLYSKCNLLKKEALKIVVINLKDSDVKDLREKFHEMDFENNGMITASVLKYAMKMLDLPETDDQIVQIINNFHVTQDYFGEPSFDYSQFIAATLDYKFYLSQEKLGILFKQFDVDENNFISCSDIKMVLARQGRKLADNEIENMLNEINGKQKGQVDFNEFEGMMYQGVDRDAVQRSDSD